MAVSDAPLRDGHHVQPWERLGVSLAVAVIGGVVVWDGWRQTGDSAYFPIAVGAGMIVLSIASILGRDKAAKRTDEAPLAKGLAGLVLLGLFIALSGRIGFLTSSMLFVPVMAILGGERRPLRIAVGTGAFVIAAYAVFNVVFSQPFPADLIFGR